MNFDLHLYGETPEELLNVLAHLGHSDSKDPAETIINIMTAAASQPQSTPAQQPDKPKTQTLAKAKEPTREPAAAPAEEPASPTTAEASDSPSQVETAPAAATSAPAPDPATLDKIRDLARSLIVAGKRAGVQAAIKATGAASVSKLPPDSYTSVWEELLKLKDEVDANASN